MPDSEKELTYTQRLSRAIDEAYESYRSGEPDAEDGLYKALLAQAKNITNYRLGWGHTTEIAREIVHRSMMALGGFRVESRSSTWFFRLAVNETCRALRDLIVNRQRFVPLVTTDEEGEERELQLEAKPENLDARIQFDQVCRHLPKPQGAVLGWMREGYSLDEIAYKTGEPLGTIRGRYRLMKDRLNPDLKETKVNRQ